MFIISDSKKFNTSKLTVKNAKNMLYNRKLKLLINKNDINVFSFNLKNFLLIKKIIQIINVLMKSLSNTIRSKKSPINISLYKSFLSHKHIDIIKK